MLTLTSLARADHHMLLDAGNDVQRWWRLVYTVLTGMVELLRVGICRRWCTVCTLPQYAADIQSNTVTTF